VANGIPDLGKKVGPLPLGVWIAVLLGGLGLAYFINKRQGGGSSTPMEEQLGAEPGVGVGGGQQFESSPPVITDPTPSGYETNDQWARAAILYLLSEGKDPNESTLALSRYISEQPLTNAQQALVGLAINKLGPPPFLPINPPDNPTTPPTNPPVTPPADPVLTAPTGLKTWGNGPSVLTVPLEWNKVTGAAYYRVYRKGVAFNVGASTDTRTTIGGLKPGTSYTFHVRAVSAKGKLGPPSSSLTAKTKK
jgi:hypothetical protein